MIKNLSANEADTFSFKIGPLKILVKTGCNPTIKADKVADKPTLYEKNTPPR